MLSRTKRRNFATLPLDFSRYELAYPIPGNTPSDAMTFSAELKGVMSSFFEHLNFVAVGLFVFHSVKAEESR